MNICVYMFNLKMNTWIFPHVHIFQRGHISKFTLQFSSVQLLSPVQFFATTAWQASLSITNSQSLLKLISIESVMPSNHLILCPPLLLPPSIFPSIRVSSNESFRIRWPKYWSFSFSISHSNEYSGLIPLGWTVWISLLSKGLSRVNHTWLLKNHRFD